VPASAERGACRAAGASKAECRNGDLWGAYTQNSRWQVYNSEESRPFRETNYETEVMLVLRNNYRLGGWQGHMAAISLNHQSNGREDPFSRSWNRIILSARLDRENWAFVVPPGGAFPTVATMTIPTSRSS